MADVEHTIEQQDARREALDLRRAGHSYRTIARMQGVAVSTAHARVTEALTAYLPRETVEDARRVELDRLDTATEHTLTIMTGSDDDELRLKAVDRLVRLAERRAKLLGLDAPTNARIEVTPTVTADQILALIDQAPDDDGAPDAHPGG